MKKTLDTNFAFLSLEDDVLFVRMKPNIDIGVAELSELFELSNKLADFQKRFVIVDTRENFNSSHDIRAFYTDERLIKFRYADAFIVTSLPMRLLVNFYITFDKPKIPSKMFNSEADALNWVNSLKKEMIKEM